MKTGLAFTFALMCNFAFAQVGINTTAPAAALDIPASDPNAPVATDGVLIPRVNGFFAPTAAQDAMIIYLALDTGTYKKGFYYWNNSITSWIPVGWFNWKQQGNENVNATTDFIGSINNADVIFKRNNILSGMITPSNTSFGFQTLSNPWSPQAHATAFGANALMAINGSYNTAVGESAIGNYGNGDYNTAVGALSMSSIGGNTFAYNNVAIGYLSLGKPANAVENTIVGSRSATNLTFGNGNTAVGFKTIEMLTSGDNNTVMGRQALASAISGTNNSAFGAFTLQNGGGVNNTAIGCSSLTANLQNDNTAVGCNTLQFNNGIGNTGIGSGALKSNYTSYNTAVGKNAIENNTNGSENSVLGYEAMKTGNSGSQNCAFGNGSLSQNNVDGNTAMGYNALSQNVNGTNNVAIGRNAFLSNGNFSNATAIGAGCNVTAGNQMRFGDSNVTSIGGIVGWTTVSDARFKTNVKADVPGISFISKLRAVSYDLNRGEMAKFLKSTSGPNPKPQRQSGFLAQEVAEAAKSSNFDFSGIDAPKNDGDYYGLRYAEFVVPLVRAVQEQQTIIERQQLEIDRLKTLIGKSEVTQREILERLSAIEKRADD